MMFVCATEYKAWHFIQTVSKGENLNDIKPHVLCNIRKVFKISFAAIQSQKVKG